MKKKMSFVMAGMMAVSSMSLGSVATFAEEPYTVKIVCVWRCNNRSVRRGIQGGF